MIGLFDFLVKPDGDRYSNSTPVGNKSLILNTEVSNHQYINREAIVVEVPKTNATNIRNGDKLLIHHNVFRRWHNMKGVEKNSRSFLSEGRYLIATDQIFLHKPDGSNEWASMNGFCFIQPLKSTDYLGVDTERPLVGIVKYTDGTYDVGDLVGFSPGDEFEFVVGGKRMYRVMTRYINTKYDYKGNEEEYNPSWAHSS
jgi:hypothetical protein